jgi:hypothetical protein
MGASSLLVTGVLQWHYIELERWNIITVRLHLPRLGIDYVTGIGSTQLLMYQGLEWAPGGDSSVITKSGHTFFLPPPVAIGRCP